MNLSCDMENLHLTLIVSHNLLHIIPLLIFWDCPSRYHYNVADSRLRQHVEKGNEDGLYISCVASALNLWALIMDAGTGFTSQVYELSAVFLHKVVNPSISFYIFIGSPFWLVIYMPIWIIFCGPRQDWIMEQWEKNYYISSIAGAANGSSLVVMSKGWWKLLSCCCLLVSICFTIHRFCVFSFTV